MTTWSTPPAPVTGTPISSAGWGQKVVDDLTVLGGAWTADGRAPAAIWGALTTAPVLNNGTLVSRYRLTGKTLDWLIVLTFGTTTTAGAGQLTFAYPGGVTAANAGAVVPVRYFDSSGGTFLGAGICNTATVNMQSISSAAGALASVTATAPFTWATGDAIAFLLTGLEAA